MKNYEKYAEEIRELKSDIGTEWCELFAKPKVLKSLGRTCEYISCGLCSALTMLWLLEDYKEPEVDWSKVEVDTPILVRTVEWEEWHKRHFAKYEGGNVYAWYGGDTSWTAPHDKSVSAWQYAKLIEGEKEHKEPRVDWNKVEVDTPILVGKGDGDWVKRYFAEYKDGIVYAWCGGLTSWDANNMMMSWKYAKLAEDEETRRNKMKAKEKVLSNNDLVYILYANGTWRKKEKK